MSKNFIDKFYEESKDQFWSLNKKIGAVLVILLLIVVMINTTGCTQNNSEEASDVMNLPEVQDPQEPQDKVKVGNDGVNAAIAGDNAEDVSIVAEQDPSSKMVAMSVEDTGRADPFLPESDRVKAAQASRKAVAKPPSYLMAPPEMIVEDMDAVNVVKTKVSGIMYDKYNPSAILNINGSDHLVRSGDLINNYKVLAINPDSVTVQLGRNVYKAGVGQLFVNSDLNYNSVANLERKFGGAGNVVNKKR